MVDVDFWPMPNLYTGLKHHLKLFYKQHPGNSSALVMPAFQFNGNGSIPKTKNDLKSTWQKDIKIFRWDYSLRRGALFERWIESQEDIALPYKKHSAECYHVLEKIHAPDYDEFLLVRWMDKVAHAYTLHAKGFLFWNYAQGFIIHLPHAAVKGKAVKDSNSCAHEYFYKSFIPYLQKNHTWDRLRKHTYISFV